MNIKDYLKYYIGCAAIRKGLTTPIVLTGKKLDYYQERDVEVKPILRRIESLTEDELKNAYIIERDREIHFTDLDFDIRKADHGFVVTRLDLLNTRLMIGFKGQVYKVIEETKRPTIEPANNYNAIFHYLLSLGIDLFGLIDAGLAIDAATINQQTEGK